MEFQFVRQRSCWSNRLIFLTSGNKWSIVSHLTILCCIQTTRFKCEPQESRSNWIEKSRNQTHTHDKFKRKRKKKQIKTRSEPNKMLAWLRRYPRNYYYCYCCSSWLRVRRTFASEWWRRIISFSYTCRFYSILYCTFL